ncbi:MAG: hypothetical protein AB1523_15225 [Bacillota bacterium]
MRDTVALGILSGLIGNLAKNISNYFLWRTGHTEVLYGHLAGSMFAAPEDVHETGNLVIGQLFDMVMGAGLGVPMVYLLKKTGKDYYLLKGAGTGLLAWGLLYGLGPNVKVISIKPKMFKTHFSALWHNVLYGLAAARAAVMLADPGTFPGNPPPAQKTELPSEQVAHLKNAAAGRGMRANGQRTAPGGNRL